MPVSAGPPWKHSLLAGVSLLFLLAVLYPAQMTRPALVTVRIYDAGTGKLTPVRVRLQDSHGNRPRARGAAPVSDSVIPVPKQAIAVMWGRQDRAEGYLLQPDGSFYVDGVFDVQPAAGRLHVDHLQGNRVHRSRPRPSALKAGRSRQPRLPPGALDRHARSAAGTLPTITFICSAPRATIPPFCTGSPPRIFMWATFWRWAISGRPISPSTPLARTGGTRKRVASCRRDRRSRVLPKSATPSRWAPAPWSRFPARLLFVRPPLRPGPRTGWRRRLRAPGDELPWLPRHGAQCASRQSRLPGVVPVLRAGRAAGAGLITIISSTWDIN